MPFFVVGEQRGSRFWGCEGSSFGPLSRIVVLHGSSFVVYMFADLTTSVPEVVYFYCNHSPWGLMVLTDLVKTINGETQLHALVDGKKIIITEASVRRDLQLADEEGVDYLPNSTILEQLTLMEYEKISQKLTFYKPFFSPQWKFLIHTILQCLSPKTTAWNEFSSTMASAIICLATNQKFNFSKYFFESMIRNLDNLSGKILMYP
ncbi:hypothetical protein Tco_0671690, partial [Tanacetum coccineum]